MNNTRYDALIIGAGPAGLSCAIAAAGRGLRVAVADAHEYAGAKLSLAGGGKGNFTNRHLDEKRYVGSDLSLVPALLKKFSCARVLTLLDSLGIPWEERDYGQIFGLKSARLFAERLEGLCRRNGVAFHFGCPVTEVRRIPSGFSVLAGENILHCRQVVIASGSPACPASGSSGKMLRIAAAWGHESLPFRPALVPLVLPKGWALEGLDGISVNVRLGLLRDGEAFFPDPSGVRPMLFTRTGISGPAALVLSCFRRDGEAILIDFLPGARLKNLLDSQECGRMQAKTLLRGHLPARLADKLCPPDLAARHCAQLSRKDRTRIEDAVHRFTVTPDGTEGLARAEACTGGVSLRSLTPTLESRFVPGLFFCGEVVDVTGILGGYNIHWALASGTLVGNALPVRE